MLPCGLRTREQRPLMWSDMVINVVGLCLAVRHGYVALGLGIALRDCQTSRVCDAQQHS
jgi:hypothetical protein